MIKEYINSPLNFTGNKYKLLPQIIPLFPKNIRTFVDLFGGSFCVGANVDANYIIKIEKTIGDYYGENRNQDGQLQELNMYYKMQITPRY